MSFGGYSNTVIYFFESTFPSQQAVQHHHRGARHFLDEEAALSEGGEVSSDEEDGEEQNRSLEGFVVSNTQCSQGINGEGSNIITTIITTTTWVLYSALVTYYTVHSLGMK